MALGLGIIAGAGALPGLLAAAHPEAVFVTFSDAVKVPAGALHLPARLEHLGALFEALREHGVGRVVLAGAMQRPALDPSAFDAETARLMPGLMAAMAGGDDGTLRAVISMFEGQGFAVEGADDLLPGLVAKAGVLGKVQPSPGDLADAARGCRILQAIGPQDVGQACVVAGGLCLAIESIYGTDAMLGFVASHRGDLPPQTGGVLVKRPKPGQDLRVDMPTIGPGTVAAAVRAGLSGIAIAAGRVIVLAQAETLAAADAADIALWAET